ncbi:CU044_5270 family protein [Microbispora sp. H10670]|uniref:CU044_5270 family protein n=1 Tax=Microbispora sp. H10670 TaxID=2729108 RepID=UPI001601DA20|nr:CU044_5270 family protein [Microbispora sp. H10670]
MTDDLTDVRRLLAPIDPAPPETFAGAAWTPRARATLRGIVSSPPDATVNPAADPKADPAAGRRPGRWRAFDVAARRRAVGRLSVRRATITGLTAGCVAAALLAGITRWVPADEPAARVPTVAMLSYHRSGGESSMTGSLPSARPILLRLAKAAGRQPEPVRPAAAGYSYLRLNEWNLSVAVSGGRTGTAVVPTVTEQWTPLSPADQVRRVERRGAPIVIGYGSERTAAAAAAGAPESDDVFAADAVLSSRSPDRLPLDAAALRRALLPPGPVPADVTEAEELVRAVIDLHSEWNVPPRLSAALWRMLAGWPGLGYLGRTTDRAGRAGEAVALDVTRGLPRRLVLVIDPGTGRLDSSEEILTTDAGKLGVGVPAVIGYRLFLRRGWAPDDRTPG